MCTAAADADKQSSLFDLHCNCVTHRHLRIILCNSTCLYVPQCPQSGTVAMELSEGHAETCSCNKIRMPGQDRAHSNAEHGREHKLVHTAQDLLMQVYEGHSSTTLQSMGQHTVHQACDVNSPIHVHSRVEGQQPGCECGGVFVQVVAL